LNTTAGSAVRDRILDAGRDQFEQYGFTKVTMDEIAQAAGMGKASIYYYFRTKDALFQAVVLREFDGFARRVEELLRREGSAADKMRSYQEHRVDYFSRLLGLNILEMPASVRLKPVLLDMFETFAQRELKLVRSIVQEGKESGEFLVGSVDRVARAFLHVVRGLRLCRIREARGRRIGPEGIASLRQELELVTNIFLGGIGARKPVPRRVRKPLVRRHNLVH
jgi:AcrR family transcriptional regulator